jgi:hypothetical protein
LYRHCWSASATEGIWNLLDVLDSLLPDLSEDSSVLLSKGLHHVWKAAESLGREYSDIGLDEALGRDGTLSKNRNDHCFFEAIVKGTGSSRLCYGSFNPSGNDVLVLGKRGFYCYDRGHDYIIYRALILRPDSATSEPFTHPQIEPASCQTYRLVGQAYVFSPVRADVDDGLERKEGVVREANIYLR